MPVFELFLSFDCLRDLIQDFIVHKLFTIVLRRKATWIYDIFMLIYAFH